MELLPVGPGRCALREIDVELGIEPTGLDELLAIQPVRYPARAFRSIRCAVADEDRPYPLGLRIVSDKGPPVPRKLSVPLLQSRRLNSRRRGFRN